jgi:3-oxoacid CoA-transferase A subunit
MKPTDQTAGPDRSGAAPVDKLIDAGQAIERYVRDGMTLMVGGFGLVGAPLTLISALNASDRRGLTVISNNLGEPGKALGQTYRLGKVKRAIGSYFTSNQEVAEGYVRGDIEVTLLPQGTFAEAIRAAGAGLGGFYTPTGVGTLLAEGRELREINGTTYLFQESIAADVALVRAHRADRLGNLVYYKTARNFNPMMATAARIVVAEVDEIADVGQLDPEMICTPHIYVDWLVLAREAL